MRGLVSGLRASPLRASSCRIRTYGKASWRLPSARSRGNRIRSPADQTRDRSIRPPRSIGYRGRLRGLVQGELSRCTPSRIYVEADRGGRWRAFEQLRGAKFTYRVIDGTWSPNRTDHQFPKSHFASALVALSGRGKFSACGDRHRSTRSSWTPTSGRAIGSPGTVRQTFAGPGRVRLGSSRSATAGWPDLRANRKPWRVRGARKGRRTAVIRCTRAAALSESPNNSPARRSSSAAHKSRTKSQQYSAVGTNRDAGLSHDTRTGTGSCA